MNIGRAFTFAFEDPNWLKKIGIAAVVFLIPFVGPIILMGWGLEITRRVINDDPEPLPDWTNLADYLPKGFRAFVVSLAYMLPALLILICGQLVSIGAAAAMSNSDSSLPGNIAVAVSVCMSCFIFILVIAAGFIIPAANGNLAASDELGAAFRFNEVLGLVRANPGAYFMVILGAGLANLLLAPLGSLVCGIGVLVTTAYTSALTGHLTGQAYKIAKAAGAAATSTAL